MPQVNILGQVWEVCELRMSDDHGCCDIEAQIITIDKDCPFPDRVELHEVMHAILAVSGLTHLLEDYQEEAIVTALENGLIQAGYKRPKVS